MALSYADDFKSSPSSSNDIYTSFEVCKSCSCLFPPFLSLSLLPMYSPSPLPGLIEFPLPIDWFAVYLRCFSLSSPSLSLFSSLSLPPPSLSSSSLSLFLLPLSLSSLPPDQSLFSTSGAFPSLPPPSLSSSSLSLCLLPLSLPPPSLSSSSLSLSSLPPDQSLFSTSGAFPSLPPPSLSSSSFSLFSLPLSLLFPLIEVCSLPQVEGFASMKQEREGHSQLGSLSRCC